MEKELETKGTPNHIKLPEDSRLVDSLFVEQCELEIVKPENIFQAGMKIRFQDNKGHLSEGIVLDCLAEGIMGHLVVVTEKGGVQYVKPENAYFTEEQEKILKRSLVEDYGQKFTEFTEYPDLKVHCDSLCKGAGGTKFEGLQGRIIGLHRPHGDLYYLVKWDDDSLKICHPQDLIIPQVAVDAYHQCLKNVKVKDVEKWLIKLREDLKRIKKASDDAFLIWFGDLRFHTPQILLLAQKTHYLNVKVFTYQRILDLLREGEKESDIKDSQRSFWRRLKDLVDF